MSLLETRSLSVAIGDLVLCRNLDLRLQAGQCWGLLGANGIGKTTLLHTLAGLRPAQSGEILVDGVHLTDLDRRSVARKLGMLFQDSRDTFPATVMETVLGGRFPHLSPWKLETGGDRGIAAVSLELVGLSDLHYRQVNTLSGGERRRLALATLFTQSPDLFLLDEPTNHLDLHHQITLLNLVTERVTRNDGGVLMSLHDVNLVMRFCSHAMLMIDADTVVTGPVADVIDSNTLSRLYRHTIREVSDNGRRYYFPE
ncbi:MAG: ABC transporter ATP-binding protein [Gammaproteobacteria bacterium]